MVGSRLIAGVGVLLFAAVQAEAASLSFGPSFRSAELGDTLQFDVVVSGPGNNIVGSFDLDVTYDPNVITAISVSFGPFLGSESAFQSLADSNVSVSGRVDLAQISLLSDSQLAALQPSSFGLATIEFVAVGSGNSSLEFVLDDVNNLRTTNAVVLDVVAIGGEVEITRGVVTNPVPEPGGAIVFAIGLLAVAISLRYRLSNLVR